MKRIILLLLLLWPAAAHALPETPYDPAAMLYYPRLTQTQQAIFDLAYAAAWQGAEKVELPEHTAYGDVQAAMSALLLDCPELCAVDQGYSVGYYRDEPERALYIDLSYVMPVDNQAKLVEQARALADQAYGDEFQREWILHDLLCQRVTYDLGAENQHSAWGALMDGRAVCDGYAAAMTLLLRLSYIECGVVQGRSLDGQVNHAWNLVKVDGAYAWLDATNNDQSGLITYFYFNMTDEWLRRSYIPDNGVILPACTDESINWHVRNYRMVETAEDMELHIFNHFRNLVKHGSMFNLRFRREEDYLAFINASTDWGARYNQTADADERVEGRLQLYYQDAQRCVVLQLGE